MSARRQLHEMSARRQLNEMSEHRQLHLALVKRHEEQKLLIGLKKMLFHVKQNSFERIAIRIEIHSNGNVVRMAVPRSVNRFSISAR